MHWIELKRKYGIDQPGGELGELVEKGKEIVHREDESCSRKSGALAYSFMVE